MADERRPLEKIAAVILAKLTLGELPRLRVEKVWAGASTGTQCYGCDEPIKPKEIEVEVDLAGALRLRLHERCFRVWQQELERLGCGSVDPES